MTVYITTPTTFCPVECHVVMVSDNLDELHAMASAIGIGPQHYQAAPVPHYALRPAFRTDAAKLGAQPIDWKVYREVA